MKVTKKEFGPNVLTNQPSALSPEIPATKNHAFRGFLAIMVSL